MIARGRWIATTRDGCVLRAAGPAGIVLAMASRARMPSANSLAYMADVSSRVLVSRGVLVRFGSVRGWLADLDRAGEILLEAGS